MSDVSAGRQPSTSIEFGTIEWKEEVERYRPRSRARTQAQSARKAIEAERMTLDWKRCKADGPGGTNYLAAASCTSRSMDRARRRHLTDSCSS